MMGVLCFVAGKIPCQLLRKSLTAKVISSSLCFRPVILGKPRLGCREVVGHGGFGTCDHNFFNRARCEGGSQHILCSTGSTTRSIRFGRHRLGTGDMEYPSTSFGRLFPPFFAP